MEIIKNSKIETKIISVIQKVYRVNRNIFRTHNKEFGKFKTKPERQDVYNILLNRNR